MLRDASATIESSPEERSPRETSLQESSNGGGSPDTLKVKEVVEGAIIDLQHGDFNSAAESIDKIKDQVPSISDDKTEKLGSIFGTMLKSPAHTAAVPDVYKTLVITASAQPRYYLNL